jgi:hypothetical protein
MALESARLKASGVAAAVVVVVVVMAAARVLGRGWW